MILEVLALGAAYGAGVLSGKLHITNPLKAVETFVSNLEKHVEAKNAESVTHAENADALIAKSNAAAAEAAKAKGVAAAIAAATNV